MKFSDKYIQSLKPKDARYDVLEGDGFTLRVYPSGAKVFCYVYKLAGTNRRLTLGRYPHLGLSAARALHRQALDARMLGHDPAGQKTVRVQTVGDLAEVYLEQWAKPRKRSWEEDQRILDVDILPKFKAVPVGALTRRQVLTMLQAIERRAPNQAWQVLKILRRMFNFALEQSFPGIEANPCAHIKLSTEHKSKDRALTPAEIYAFWVGMERLRTSEPMRRALRTILATAQRPGEVLAMHRREIDGDWWTIPGERTKNKRPQRVYLTPWVKTLIGDNDEYMFSYSEEPMANTAASTAVRRMFKRKDAKGLTMAPFTPHDLRRTAATLLGAAGYTTHLIGKLLNHTDQTVTGIYNRHEYDKEKREMLEALEGILKGILEADPAAKNPTTDS